MNLKKILLDGKIPKFLKNSCKYERLSVKKVVKDILAGRTVFLYDRFNRKGFINCLIGKDASVKVNANIGTSKYKSNLRNEKRKMRIAIETGTDTIMDLSTGENIDYIRNNIIESTTVPLGTVPIYQSICDNSIRKNNIADIKSDEIIENVFKHIRDGVEFITIHSGVTLNVLKEVKKQKRTIGIVSRGGSFLCSWMNQTGLENPLYKYFDDILELAAKYDTVLSLGDGCRPGCIDDANDKLQLMELRTLGRLTKRALKKNVQVIIEGPGHVPIHLIQKNVELAKKYCYDAPFYVLGPITTDIAPGYDHITSAIGGSLAAYFGADFLCYVTPAEHLALPNIEDVRYGVIASKIAAHTGDIGRNYKKYSSIDKEISVARKKFDWKKQGELCIDKIDFDKIRKRDKKLNLETCTMCGDYCSMKMI